MLDKHHGINYAKWIIITIRNSQNNKKQLIKIGFQGFLNSNQCVSNIQGWGKKLSSMKFMLCVIWQHGNRVFFYEMVFLISCIQFIHFIVLLLITFSKYNRSRKAFIIIRLISKIVDTCMLHIHDDDAWYKMKKNAKDWKFNFSNS